MSAATLIREAASAGVWIGLDGDKLSLKAQVKPPDDLLERLKASKPEIIELLRRQAEVVNALKQPDAVDNAAVDRQPVAAQPPSPASSKTPWPEPKITGNPPFGADHIPSRYEAEWTALLAGCPSWAAEWQWAEAIFSCRDLIGEWGAELLRLNWPAKDIFDRWQGLGWFLKGKKVTAIGARHAFLEDGRIFERICR